MAGSRELDYELRRLYLRCIDLHKKAEDIVPEAASARTSEWVFIYPKDRVLIRSQKDPSLRATGWSVTFEIPFGPNLVEGFVYLGWKREGLANVVLSSPAPREYEGKILKQERRKEPLLTDLKNYPQSINIGLLQKLNRRIETDPQEVRVWSVNSIILPQTITLETFTNLPYTTHRRRFD